MGNCFSSKKKIKEKKETNLFEYDDEYKYSIPQKLSTIIEEKTMDLNVSTDKI